MENNSISQKRPFTNNNGGFITSQRSVYDDVFSGPPKLGPPTLAPRLEDYTEIFNGFHSSRASSIPILDIPLTIEDDDDSLGFDYGEVFGECKGFDWTASFQDVVGQSSAGYDSSDEPWSPAKSESLSDEIDPLAASDKSYRWSDEDSHRPLQTKRQLNVSYNRPGQKTVETVLAGVSPVTKFGEDEHCNIYATDDVHCKKSLCDPLESGCYVHENDDNLSERRCSDTFSVDRPFMTISDISLRTKPCRVPPPSRPPPAFAVKKGSNSKLKASKSYAFERVADTSTTTPLFFDVEVDGNLYVDGMKDANLKQALGKGSKRRVDSWDDSKWHLEEVMKEEEKVNKSTDSCTSFEGDKLLQTPGQETIIAGPVAWREEKEYFEVIEKDVSMEYFESVAHSNVSMEFPKAETSKSLDKTESEVSDENEDHDKFKVEESFRRDIERNHLDMPRDNHDWGSQHRGERLETMSDDKKEFRAKVMPDKLVKENTIVSDHDQRDGESRKPRVNFDETEANMMQNASFKIDQRFTDAQNSNRKPEKYFVRNEYRRRFDNLGHAETGVGVKQNGTSRKENENKLEESHMPKEDEKTTKNAYKHGESGNSCSAVDRKVGEQISFAGDKNKEMLMEVVEDKLNELKLSSALKDLALERGKERNGDVLLREDKHSGVEKAEIGQDMNLRADAGVVLPSEDAKGSVPTEMNGRPVKWDNESNVPVEGDDSQVIVNPQNEAAAEVAANDENPQNLGKGNTELKTQAHRSVNEARAGSVDPLVVGKLKKVSYDEDEKQEEKICFVTNKKAEDCIRQRPSCIMPDKITSPMGYSHEIDKNISAKDNQDQMMKRTQVTVEEVETRHSFTPRKVVNGSRMEDASSVSECNKDQQHSSKILLNQSVERKDENQQHLSRNAANQNTENKDKNTKDSLVAKDQKVCDRIRRDIELENEHLRRIEEEREREREREKDRMAVDKAAFEAYERSYVDTREKAERAAVERATTEMRQRAMAVARERLEKTSMEARQRAERAAVERATAEARQRAVERSKADKAVYGRAINDRLSVPSRDTKQSFVSSNAQFQDQGLASGSRHSIFPADVGAEGESPQRCKARLERYRRTAERAANALAEKNKRDLLAQKEREERNRVAETLDAEVKRWSRGKEGNLRALLSTLQYILGPNSGWQPVPLTEVITTAAVKKAYRKATLCVHPDKLQQRGATIHQKYTCEKVFDLLKEAWNKFNSEER